MANRTRSGLRAPDSHRKIGAQIALGNTSTPIRRSFRTGSKLDLELFQRGSWCERLPLCRFKTPLRSARTSCIGTRYVLSVERLASVMGLTVPDPAVPRLESEGRVWSYRRRTSC